MGMTKDELFEVLDNGLSDSVIEIQDLAGDNDHYAVKIISNKFKGLSKITVFKFFSSKSFLFCLLKIFDR